MGNGGSYQYRRENATDVARRYFRQPIKSVFEDVLTGVRLDWNCTYSVMADSPHDDTADCILRSARIQGATLQYVAWKY